MIHMSTGAGFRHPSVHEFAQYDFILLSRGDLRSGVHSSAGAAELSFHSRDLVTPERPGVSYVLIHASRSPQALPWFFRRYLSETLDRSRGVESATLSSIPIPDEDDSYP